MNLIAAKSLLVRDRMDWNGGHLRWFAERLYWRKRRASK